MTPKFSKLQYLNDFNLAYSLKYRLKKACLLDMT